MFFLIGGSRHLLLGSPAGRCGLIGLSHFLQFASYLAFAVFLPVVSPFTHTATPTRARAVIPSIVTFHSAPFSLGSICFSSLNPCGCSSVSLRFTQLHRRAQKPPIVHSLHSISLFLSFQPLLFHPTLKAKSPPALPKSAAVRRPHSSGFLLPAPLLHSQSARASPLRREKQFRYRSSCFFLLRSGSRLLYLFSV